MATLLTAKQKEIIRNIIYAVESGGQVYGKQDYFSLIEAGTNSTKETAITIGAGQWYGVEAKELLNFIRSKNKTTFAKLDTEGIGADLDKANWSKYAISKTSNKAKCIINIIGSTIGIKYQDLFMENQITEYAKSIQQTYGAMSVDAIAECINIKHLGGDSALKRILSKTAKPYSAKSIKATLDLDLLDKSSNNQVGDYKTRQNKVYNMIVKYLIPTIASTSASTNKTNNGGKSKMTEVELRSKIVNWMVKYVGITEGSAEHLEIIKFYNDSKLCSRYKMTKKDAWCATTVSAAFIANGMAGAAGSGSLFECVECGCGEMIKLAQKQGIWVEDDKYVPVVGDVIMYDWDDSGSTSTKDNTGWPEHVGVVASASGNTFKVVEGNIKDSVGYRAMTVNGKYIRGFITPNYAKFATTVVTESKPVSSSGSAKTLNRTCMFKGTVTASSLNVRDWAGTTNTKVLREIAKGTVVEVCDTIQDKDGDDWYYIKESGKYGFVSSDYIAKQSVTATSTSSKLNETCKFKGKVTASSLNVREWAGTEYKSLRKLAKGTAVQVCDEVKASTGKTWYYIKASGKYGFVSAEYIARV